MNSQDCGFTVSQIEELANMLGSNDENTPQHQFGSALNPGTLHGNEEKEVAKPGVKMNAVVNNRNPMGGGAMILEDDLKKAKDAQELKKKERML